MEGYSERDALPAFLKRWLDPRLARPVGVSIIRLEGAADYKRKIAGKVRFHLGDGRGGDVVAAIGLLDLYGSGLAFPASATTADERYAWAKSHLEDDVVRHPRFRQHFAVHELEAWVLAEPTIFPSEVAARIEPLSRTPELVNFDQPPAVRLARIYERAFAGRRSYRKIVDGASLFAKLDPALAVARCPSLKRMLDEMLDLATNAEAR